MDGGPFGSSHCSPLFFEIFKAGAKLDVEEGEATEKFEKCGATKPEPCLGSLLVPVRLLLRCSFRIYYPLQFWSPTLVWIGFHDRQLQVKEAYKRMVWDTHPDLFPAHQKPQAESKFKLVNILLAEFSYEAVLFLLFVTSLGLILKWFKSMFKKHISSLKMLVWMVSDSAWF